MYLRVIILAVLLIFSYFLGQSSCQNKIITKEIEVVRYVKSQENQILSRPHAAKPELLELMRNGKL